MVFSTFLEAHILDKGVWVGREESSQRLNDFSKVMKEEWLLNPGLEPTYLWAPTHYPGTEVSVITDGQTWSQF